MQAEILKAAKMELMALNLLINRCLESLKEHNNTRSECLKAFSLQNHVSTLNCGKNRA